MKTTKLNVIIVLILSFLFISCNKKDDDKFVQYKIKEGKTWSKHGLYVSHDKKSIQFSFKVDHSMMFGYNGGVNKIAGIGKYNPLDWEAHQENSCRLGWQDHSLPILPPMIVMYQYVYRDGERYSKRIDTLPEGTYYCDIGRVNDEWHLTLDGITHICPAGEDWKNTVRLFPNLNEEVNQDVIVAIDWH